MKPRLLLIDADTFIYLAAAANEVETQWDTWMWTLYADLDASIRRLDSDLKQLQADLKADRIILALTDDHNFRKDIMPSYKAHRLKTRKPVCYQPMREYVKEVYETFQRPGLEGDDVVGILATAQKFAEYDRIMVSPDKDMLSVPGKLYRCREEEGKTAEDLIVSTSEVEADYQHMFQTLTGDATDGYPGCPKVGPVKAEKILESAWMIDDPGGRNFNRKAAWLLVVNAYEKAGLSEEVALTNAQVARICRADNFDFKKGVVKLWDPQ